MWRQFRRNIIPFVKRGTLLTAEDTGDSHPCIRHFGSSAGDGGSSWRWYGSGAAVLVCGLCVGAKVWWHKSRCQAADKRRGLGHPHAEGRHPTTQTIEEAIRKSEDYLLRIKDETGSPGIVAAVSVDGRVVWSVGLGFSDVENRVACTPDTVMRIASISKPITATIVGRLLEQGMLDIDVPVQTYLPAFPRKLINGQEVAITTRNVLTHTSGIRHYGKDFKEKREEDKVSEFEEKEYYIKKHFSTVQDSLQLFQHDPLIHKPGTTFLYTTHGYTLVSAVIEAVMKKPFKEVLQALFKDLGLETTYLDLHSPLIYNRSRYYVKSKAGRLVNAPHVDLSYKWAGGGLLSTVGDLVKFGNIMLYSYQYVPGSEGQSKPSSTETTSKPSSTETTSKPSSTETTSKPSSTETTSKPSSTETTSKPSSTETTSKPSSTETTSKPSSTETTSKPSSTETTSKPSSTETTSKPSSTETTSKPSSTETTSKPSSTETTSKPSSTETTSKPSSTDQPSKAPSNKGPAYLIATSRNSGGGSSRRDRELKGYLKQATVEKLWSVEEATRGTDNCGYGLGWSVVPEQIEHGCCRHQRCYVSHTGGAVGASSALVIVPCSCRHIAAEEKGEGRYLTSTEDSKDRNLPSGVVVAIITNMISVSVKNTALTIAKEFENVDR